MSEVIVTLTHSAQNMDFIPSFELRTVSDEPCNSYASASMLRQIVMVNDECVTAAHTVLCGRSMANISTCHHSVGSTPLRYVAKFWS